MSIPVAASSDVPDPSNILELLNGFRRSAVLLSAVRLGIFDAIASSPCNLSQLALRLQLASKATPDTDAVDVDSLSRLLSACTSLNLLSNSGSEGNYSLSPASAAFLTSSSPCSLAGYALHSANVVYPLFGGLHHSVQSGQPCWQEQLGRSGSELFAHVYRTPEALLSFMTGMHSFAQLLQSFDLSWVRTAVDIGGATGAVMLAAARLLPGLQSAFVVDLEPVVQAGRSHFSKPPFVSEVEASALLSRVHWLAADMFLQPDRIPGGVDLVVMTRILHDWDPPRVTQLMKLAWDKLRPGGALLLGEMLLKDDIHNAATNPAAVLQDLNMLVQTGGRERDLAEYTQLLYDAEFNLVRGRITGSYLDAIIAVK
ncbi:MAG: hypothetical protein WDW38_001838 [Sanguina aurantia]